MRRRQPTKKTGMPDTVVPDSPPSPADLHTAADCPVAVRQVAAQIINGTRGYGGTIGHAVLLPDSVVRIAAEPDADCPTWRIDVHAAVPQPDGYDKRFQEQDTFNPDCALEVTFDVRPAPHGPMLCLYQHKEWWTRPAWCTNPADIPPRTQLVLWRSDERGDLPAAAKTDVPTGGVLAGGKPQQDTDEPAPAATWTAVMAFSGDDVRADPSATVGRFRLNVASNRAGRTALADTVAYVAQGADPYAVIRVCVAAGARRNGIATVD